MLEIYVLHTKVTVKPHVHWVAEFKCSIHICQVQKLQKVIKKLSRHKGDTITDGNICSHVHDYLALAL